MHDVRPPDSPSQRWQSDNMIDVRDLRHVLMTCLRWRDVVLGTSSLWSTVIQLNKKHDAFYQNYFDRCPSGPLYVYAERGVNDVLVDFVRGHGDRIKELYLACSSYCTGKCRAFLCESRFDGLERAFLLLHGDRSNISSLPHTLPILADSTHLRSLLLRATAYLPNVSFPELTVLRFRNLAEGPTLEDFFAFASGLPQLRTLELSSTVSLYASETQSISESSRDSPISLPQLNNFIVENFFFTPRIEERETRITGMLHQLLSRLSFPSTCTLRLGTVAIQNLIGILNQVLGPGRTVSHIHLQGEVQYSIEHHSSGGGISINALHADEDPVDRTNATVVIPGVRGVTGKGAAGTVRAAFRHMFTNISSFTGVRHLWIDASLGFLLRPRTSILPALKNLEFLVIYPELDSAAARGGESVRELLSILEPVNDGSASEPPCPSLSTLAINCGPEEKQFLRDLDQEVTHVLKVAEARAAAGHPISRIYAIFQRKSLDCFREYDGARELVRVVDEPGVAYGILKSEWSRGTNWQGVSQVLSVAPSTVAQPQRSPPSRGEAPGSMNALSDMLSRIYGVVLLSHV
ncbi:hypothetical protein ONZ51_g8274 [Trametes cubensis]|uniref:F-box domain-containing protein n=1 Tax=Trametes cubensis TaxID=1111947 RepID=A0AAD7TNJ4_9APHY|nr:hypothetical protein ONZ51_g8274 [Trametes cubensis]